ncbi:DUF3644 domain-containing protein [Limosilactobacillus reuteri]|uniref:DUF3644 domain-containing protein n=1 Tax=Limosilactobacillus reuteri TaxID=1598 RepID=A0A517D6I4_LIMRT|nr:DUF3644 domain-containing protein [Limosilactobacillus reuteri]QDR72950.1 DUF3644 domain-containing protein [Limosilactobacillus reuteri]
MEDMSNRLIEKSREAFTMAIEIYNRPTIKYRVEGFSFFICNAWELMLKAFLIKTKGEKSIYFKDGQTIPLSECLKRIITNSNDPIRKNMADIIELRNTATHFVTEDYEQIYAPLFQACIINFINKSNDLLEVDMAKNFDQHFLSLSVNVDELSDNVIQKKYPKDIAEKILATKNKIPSDAPIGYRIPIDHQVYITKDPKKADLIVTIAKNGDIEARIIKELKDPQNTHPYSYNEIIKQVNKRLKQKKIKISFGEHGNVAFSTYQLNMFIKFYNIKSDIRYAYEHKISSSKLYTYSPRLVDFIYKQLSNDPEHALDNLKAGLNKL